MPSLKSIMSDDISTVILNTDDFAELANYQPDGSVTTFPIIIAIGDVTDQMISIATGRADQQEISATGKLSVMRAGIATIEGSERPPQPGDVIIIPSGAQAGVWTIVNVSVDGGDGAVMRLRFENHYDLSARDVSETR
jgi:hypothetical protein